MAKKQTEIQEVDIKDIIPNPNNPRLIKDEKFLKLVKSIKDFPEMLSIRPIVVNKQMVVLGGNMRLKALKEAGIKKVPVIISDLTEEQQREFIIKDNVGFGEWDWSMIANEWDVDQITEWGLDIPGFELNQEYLGEDFSLAEGDKSPFEQMTFTLAVEQATVIKNAINEIMATDEYRYAEVMGNENSNGNALYLIVASWAGQRI